MAKSRSSRFRRLLGTVFLLALSAGLFAFSLYLLVLDREIRSRFAGARWALPAQVYAAPLELYPGLPLDAAALQNELERFGYRRLPELGGPGTFVVAPNRFEVHTRGFRFWDGAQPDLVLSLMFDAGGVSQLLDLEAGAPRSIVRLDPMLIGSIYPQHGEDRVLVKFEEVPPLLRDGLVAVEDRDFYSHFGLSPRAILRATLANLRAGRVVQGGSTITQQLVKNFFLTSEQTLARKLPEACMAVLLEAHYEKEEILEAYFNEIWLGQDGNRAVHGFGLAAQFYFNKPLTELRPSEIALLVGIGNGASYYNPRRHPERALARRNLVLQTFADEGLLTPEEFAAAHPDPLGVMQGRLGGAERYPAFVELVKRQLRGQYQDSDLTNEGLRVYTTLDPRAQEALEGQIVQRLPAIEKARKLPDNTLQAAGVVTSVDGGEVLALVGGRDVRFYGFNRALDSRRSIGSLAKPFVYLAALQRPQQFNLHTILDDEPIELTLPNKTVWRPRNYDGELHGPQPAYLALAHSYNLPTVQLGLEVGPEEVLRTMRAAGIGAEAIAVPAILLGAVDAAPLEVAQAYATLAAGGFQAPLSAIREVQTKDGEPLTRYPIRLKQTLPEGPVYLINWAMQKVMTLGTGRGAYSVLPPNDSFAGKTGTTDDYRDAWFAGFGADRVAVIWVGRDDYQPTGLSGSSGALPVWAGVMKSLRARGLELTPPGDIEEQPIDPDSGLRADEHCVDAIVMPFIRGYAPAEEAPCAGGTPLDWLRDLFRGR
jgi:penicillin-binding protein 1B